MRSIKSYATVGFDSNTGHGLFVEGWVEHPDIFSWISPPLTDQPKGQQFFLLSAKPNKMAEDRTVSHPSFTKNGSTNQP
jgi:hypothetical protein